MVVKDDHIHWKSLSLEQITLHARKAIADQLSNAINKLNYPYECRCCSLQLLKHEMQTRMVTSGLEIFQRKN